MEQCLAARQPADPFAKLLSPWPVKRPSNWLSLLNGDQAERDEAEVRVSLERNRPMGDPAWIARMAKKLGLEHTLRPPGRPRIRRAKADR